MIDRLAFPLLVFWLAFLVIMSVLDIRQHQTLSAAGLCLVWESPVLDGAARVVKCSDIPHDEANHEVR